MESLNAAYEWVLAHPTIGVLGAVALIAGLWFLRRPDPVLKEGAQEFERLSKKNRGRYDDLRPLK